MDEAAGREAAGGGTSTFSIEKLTSMIGAVMVVSVAQQQHSRNINSRCQGKRPSISMKSCSFSQAKTKTGGSGRRFIARR